jgi:hypothetical protein
MNGRWGSISVHREIKEIREVNALVHTEIAEIKEIRFGLSALIS